MAIHDFKSQRLFVEVDLSKGYTFEASREQANYLLNVLRMTEGSSLLVFNGRDGEWRVEVTVEGRKKCSLTCHEQTRIQPETPSLTYCFAPLKTGRLDYMVQKAVEMGAGILQPVMTQYTQIRQIKETKLRANAIEAAEQCGILSIPEIREAVLLKDLPDALGGAHLIFCDEEAHDTDGLSALKAKNPSALALLIGPEGGFSQEERNHLKSLENVTLLGLGPRILRADTAGVAALAVIQARIGDWYQNN